MGIVGSGMAVGTVAVGSWSSSSPTVVGDTSVGTGISVRVPGAELGAMPEENTAESGGTCTSGISVGALRVAILESKVCVPPAVTVAPSASAGEVGEGTSVGTGISVGDWCISLLIEKNAEDIAADCTGTSGTVFVGTSRPVKVRTSRIAGEVGEGRSVGTGNSLGDFGASRGSRVGGPLGTSISRVGCVAVTVACASPCGEVGEGLSVGTGSSLGDWRTSGTTLRT